jgi:MFS family permease
VLAVLTMLFREQERGRAVSWVVMGVSAGLALGPIVAGYLLSRFWWGSIFLINVPVMLLAIAAIGVLLPESRDPRPGRADLPGGLLSTAGLVVFVYGVIAAPRGGWADPLALAAGGVGAVLLAVFVAWELHTPQPMIDVRLFARSRFAWGTAGAALISFALYGLLFTLPQYLQFVAGVDTFGTGVRLLPLVGGIVVGTPAGTRLAARFGYRVPVAAGLFLVSAALAAGATTGVSSGYGFMAGWLILAGLGGGMAMAPAVDAVLSVLPAQRSGSGAAIPQALRYVAGALGVALLGSLLAHGYADRLDTAGLPAEAADVARRSIAGALAVAARYNDPVLAASARAAFVHGMALALNVWAVVALLGAVCIAVFLPGRPEGEGP